MDLFLLLQIMFDAVLLFGVLFLFHFSVHHSQKKNEESDILKNVQVQEIKENLQELLLTLKQLGKEVSDDIQEQVRSAEEKTEIFKKIIQKLQKDLNKTQVLADEVSNERIRLEEKVKVIQTLKKKTTRRPSPTQEPYLSPLMGEKYVSAEGIKENDKNDVPPRLNGRGGTVGFSSGLVREVYRLADSEMGLNEIIQHTQLSRAEVQLILNLRDNRFTTPN